MEIEKSLTSLLKPFSQQNLLENKIDYELCALEICQNIRGDLTGRELSQKLGYSFNQVGKWESGAKRIKWGDFIQLCEVQNLPLSAVFNKIFWTFNDEFSTKNSLKEILKRVDQIKKQADSKPNKSISENPDLSEVLLYIDQIPAMLIAFLSGFIDCSKIKSLAQRYAEYSTRLELVHIYPQSIFINAALKVSAYQDLQYHDEDVLAKHSACSVEQLRHLLGIMIQIKIIHFDGKKYQPCPFDFSFSSIPSAKLRGLTKYTTDLTAERYSLTPVKVSPSCKNANISSVRVNALSYKASKEIMDLISEFHHRIGKVVINDQNNKKDNVQIILVHSFASTVNSHSEKS